MSIDSAASEVDRLVKKYKSLSHAARQDYNEGNTRKDFILPLFHALEWDVYSRSEVSAEDKVSRGWVDFAFRLGGVPRFFLETKANGAWYAFSAPRNLDAHDSAQLLVPLLADRGLYAMLPAVMQEYCLMASGGFSISMRNNNLSLQYVLALLNSALLYWNLKQVSNVFRGGWITCTKQYVGQLPIRRIDFSDPTDKARHDRMVEMVEEMLRLQKEHAEAERNLEDRRHELKGKIDRLDAAIDALVYELYGLTEEEIKIVEGRQN